MISPWNTIEDFETELAKYSGSKHAVAVDTCTAALLLCCIYLRVGAVSIPRRTYYSVPCSIINAGGSVLFDDREWRGVYTLDPYPIVDGACRFRRNMYQPGSLHCLSFQYRKHLAIGRGGAVLTDNDEAAAWLRLARFHGRPPVPLNQGVPVMVGWPFHMEPERAARGLVLLRTIPDDNDDKTFAYPDLSQFSDVYRAVAHKRRAEIFEASPMREGSFDQ